jgi:hypothetical protein
MSEARERLYKLAYDAAYKVDEDDAESQSQPLSKMIEAAVDAVLAALAAGDRPARAGEAEPTPMDYAREVERREKILRGWVRDNARSWHAGDVARFDDLMLDLRQAAQVEGVAFYEAGRAGPAGAGEADELRVILDAVLALVEEIRVTGTVSAENLAGVRSLVGKLDSGRDPMAELRDAFARQIPGQRAVEAAYGQAKRVTQADLRYEVGADSNNPVSNTAATGAGPAGAGAEAGEALVGGDGPAVPASQYFAALREAGLVEMPNAAEPDNPTVFDATTPKGLIGLIVECADRLAALRSAGARPAGDREAGGETDALHVTLLQRTIAAAQRFIMASPADPDATGSSWEAWQLYQTELAALRDFTASSGAAPAPSGTATP